MTFFCSSQPVIFAFRLCLLQYSEIIFGKVATFEKANINQESYFYPITRGCTLPPPPHHLTPFNRPQKMLFSTILRLDLVVLALDMSEWSIEVSLKDTPPPCPLDIKCNKKEKHSHYIVRWRQLFESDPCSIWQFKRDKQKTNYENKIYLRALLLKPLSVWIKTTCTSFHICIFVLVLSVNHIYNCI